MVRIFFRMRDTVRSTNAHTYMEICVLYLHIRTVPMHSQNGVLPLYALCAYIHVNRRAERKNVHTVYIGTDTIFVHPNAPKKMHARTLHLHPTDRHEGPIICTYCIISSTETVQIINAIDPCTRPH